jgi:hypothetical protein
MYNTYVSKITQLSVALLISLGLIFGSVFPVFAQTPTATPSGVTLFDLLTATDSTLATDSGIATVAASVEPLPPPQPEKDITETSGEVQDKLVEFLNQRPVPPLSWYNPLEFGIRKAVSNGVPANVLVLILLFPVITSIISMSRHVIGLKGFGIYTTAVLSVAFLSTGIFNGILLFAVTLVASSVMKKIIRRLQLQYLPRTAMLLWGVSVIMLLFLIGLSFVPITNILSIRIFPVLIIMLLTENFLESQLTGSPSEARQMTIETLIIAILCSVLIGLEPIQKFVLLQPELTLLTVAGLNMIVGRYTGLRLLEWLRFRTIINT